MTQYIAHSGRKGMHWGDRNYQNPDGTWTEQGKARRRAEYRALNPESNKPSKPSAPKKSFSERRAERKNLKMEKAEEKRKQQEAEEKQKAADEARRRAEEDKDLDRQIAEEKARKEEYRKQQLEIIEEMKMDTAFYKSKQEALAAQIAYNSTVASLHPKKITFGQKYVEPALARAVTNITDNVAASVADSAKKWINKKINGPDPIKYEINQTHEYDNNDVYKGKKINYKYTTTKSPFTK